MMTPESSVHPKPSMAPFGTFLLCVMLMITASSQPSPDASQAFYILPCMALSPKTKSLKASDASHAFLSAFTSPFNNQRNNAADEKHSLSPHSFLYHSRRASQNPMGGTLTDLQEHFMTIKPSGAIISETSREGEVSPFHEKEKNKKREFSRSSSSPIASEMTELKSSSRVMPMMNPVAQPAMPMQPQPMVSPMVGAPMGVTPGAPGALGVPGVPQQAMGGALMPNGAVPPQESGMSTGAIMGITIAVIVGVFILVICIGCIWKKMKKED